MTTTPAGYIVAFLSGGLLRELEVHHSEPAAHRAVLRLVEANGFSDDGEEYHLHSWASGSEQTTHLENLGTEAEYAEWTAKTPERTRH